MVMSKLGDWIRDNMDKIELIMIKMLGTVLTSLAIIGYLDSVSKFDNNLNIHNLVLATILLMISLTGYSVYVYTMMTDNAGDATLLNYLYMVLAITNKVKSLVVFYWIVLETLFPKQNDFYKRIGIEGTTIFVSISIALTLTTIAGATLLKKKNPERYMDLSQKNPRTVMIMFGTILIFTFTVFISGFQIKHLEEKRKYYRSIFFPITLAALCILLKVNNDEYRIVKRLKRKLRNIKEKISGQSNSVNPVIEAGMDENAIVINSIEDHSQVCKSIITLLSNIGNFWLCQELKKS